MRFTDVLVRRSGAARSKAQAMAVVVAMLTTVMVVVVDSLPAHAASGASNGKLAVTVYDTSFSPDIWVMDADGTNPVNLTAGWMHLDGTTSSETGPMWSPDGTQITFISTRGSSGVIGEFQKSIWIVDADGSNPLQVMTPDPARFPSWSPDGKWIVFTRSMTTSEPLYKIHPDGTGLTIISDGLGTDSAHSARWAPDGTEIVYTRHGTFSLTGINLVKPDGTGETYFGPIYSARPRWSTDSNKIAYSYCTGSFGAGCDVRVVNRDGSGDALLVAGAVGPVWSPDGATMLYSEWTGPGPYTKKLYSIPVGGGAATEIPIPFDPAIHSVQADWEWQPIPAPLGDPVSGLVDPTQGEWHLYDDAGTETTSFFFGNPGDFPIVGDWDCDGVETPGMYRQSDGFVYLRNSNTQGNADVKFFFGNPGDVPIAGDFNDDGCGTVSIYRPSNQTFYIINKLGENNGGLGAAEFSYVFGNPGDKPFVGDFDGDGTETVGLHRESTGLVYFRNSHTQGNADAQFIFGNPGDRLVAGDWNSDGMFSPALFRPSNTTMYFRYTNTQGNADNQFVPNPNGSTWLPVAGQFK